MRCAKGKRSRKSHGWRPTPSGSSRAVGFRERCTSPGAVMVLRRGGGRCLRMSRSRMSRISARETSSVGIPAALVTLPEHRHMFCGRSRRTCCDAVVWTVWSCALVILPTRRERRCHLVATCLPAVRPEVGIIVRQVVTSSC